MGGSGGIKKGNNMSINIQAIPFAELVERTNQFARVGENALYKVREAIQHVYVQELPSKFDWDFLVASSSFQTVEKVDAGTVSATTGGTAVTGSSTAFADSMVGRKIKFSSNEAVYTVNSVTSATSLGLLESLLGEDNLSSDSYVIYEPKYTLASDFDRFPSDGGVYKWQGGKKVVLPEIHYQEYNQNFQPTPQENQSNVRLAGTNTLGTQMVELVQAPSKAKNYGYDYVRQLKPLTMSTAGTIVISSAGTTVSGTSTKFTEVTTGSYLRIDGNGIGNDSKWYKISSITNDTSLRLASTFDGSAVSGASYTVSSAPDMPSRLHSGCIWGALRNLTVDQNDPNANFYNIKFAEVMSDGKRLYITRVYSQEFHTIAEEYRYRY